MAADDKLYFVGFMPEHFKGNGYTGSPTYVKYLPGTTVNAKPDYNDDYPSYNWGSSGIQTVSDNSVHLSGGLVDENHAPLTDFYLTISVCHLGTAYNANNGRLVFGVFNASNTPVIYLNAYNNIAQLNVVGKSANASPQWYFPDLPNESIYRGYVTGGIYIKYVLHVQNWGTSETTVSLSMYLDEAGTKLHHTETMTADSSDAPDLSYFGCVGPWNWRPNWLAASDAWWYAYVSNFKPDRCTFDYQFPSTVGQYTDWSGNTTPWYTSPITYAVDTDGLYTAAPGSTVTFTRPRAMRLPSRHNVRLVMLQTAGYMGEDGEIGTIQPVVYDPTSGKTRQFGANQQITYDGNLATWYSNMNPITNTPWLDSDESLYQYGIKRVV